MKKRKNTGVVLILNNDIVEVKMNSPKHSGTSSLIKNAVKKSTVKMYRQSSTTRKGLLGIGYKPSYYIGQGKIITQKNPGVLVLKQSNTSNQILRAGDKIVFEINDTKSIESN